MDTVICRDASCCRVLQPCSHLIRESRRDGLLDLVHISCVRDRLDPGLSGGPLVWRSRV